MMRRAWSACRALTPEKRAALQGVVVGGLAGGFLARRALADPNWAEALLIAVGALWVAVMLLTGVLGWRANRRRRGGER
jgi:hypothetical protein